MDTDKTSLPIQISFTPTKRSKLVLNNFTGKDLITEPVFGKDLITEPVFGKDLITELVFGKNL